nr:hypothetical protein [Tanacetum cinerariifolium]
PGIPIYPKKKTEEGMVDLQPMEEEFQRAITRDTGTKTHEVPTEPVLQMKKNPSHSPAFNKENIDVLRTMIKKHDQQAKMKATPRKLAYIDSDKKAPTRSLARGFSDRFSLKSSGTSDTCKQTRSASKSQRTPFKNRESTHLKRSKRLEDRSITKEKTRRERTKPKGKTSRHQETSLDSEREEEHQGIRGKKDLEDHLGNFSATTEQEEWLMSVWCKMFHQTLDGATRNWFDDLDPKSVNSFEELSQKFLEEFSQQKRYAKDPTEIHGIKRRQNEGLQTFMDRFKSKSSHIKGVPLGYILPAWTGGPKKARNRGGPREARRNMGVYTPYLRKDTFTPLLKTPKEILAMENVSFPKPPPLIETPEKQNMNKFCDYQEDRGHNTNDYYQLKRKIKEVVASKKLANLVKDIRQANQRNERQGRNSAKAINMIREGGNYKRSFKERRFGLTNELTFPAVPQNQLMDEPFILEGIIEDNQVRRILIDGGRRTGMRSIRVGSHMGMQTDRKDARFKERGKHGGIRMGQIKKNSCSTIRHGETTKDIPFVEPVTHKKRPMTPDERLVLKEEVFRWLKEGMIRLVWHPVPVKLENRAWKVQVDYSSLNKVYAKDIYPFTKEKEELASIMGYP